MNGTMVEESKDVEVWVRKRKRWGEKEGYELVG